MLKIGLTGSIASGKSEVEKILKDKFLVVDLDVVSHEFLKTIAKKEILEEFKTTDRKELAKIVFNDENKKRKLEEILHPKLKKYVLDIFNSSDKPVVISGALLYEAGFFPLFDKTIFIDAPIDLRLLRLQKRNGFSEIEAKKRIDVQKNEGKKFADFIIENSSTIEELNKKVMDIFNLFI